MNNVAPVSNVLLRMLWFGRSTGSGEVEPFGCAFIATLKDRECVVTANHVAEGCQFQPYVRFRKDWHPFKWQTLVSNKELDIAVLQLAEPVGVSLHVDYGFVKGAVHGQLAYALGFPTVVDYNNNRKQTDHIVETDGRPVALPTMLLLNMQQGADIVYTAAYVNDGYSGGAVVFPVLSTNRWAFAGTIIEYAPFPRSVYDRSGNDTGLLTHQHTGLVVYRPWSLIEHLIDVALNAGQVQTSTP